MASNQFGEESQPDMLNFAQLPQQMPAEGMMGLMPMPMPPPPAPQNVFNISGPIMIVQGLEPYSASGLAETLMSALSG